MKLILKRSFRHWNFRYLRDRVALALYQRRFPDSPWLTRQAVEILNDWLKAEDAGVEWGAGRSTIWFASKVAKLTSIEHDKQWCEHVGKLLVDKGIKNVELLHVSLATSDLSPRDHEYVKIAEKLPEQGLDFVLVDGKLRDHCVKVAMRLLKPGGLLIIDNAERYLPHPTCAPRSVLTGGIPPTELWKVLIKELELWRCIWTSNGVFDTAFFIRPASKDS